MTKIIHCSHITNSLCTGKYDFFFPFTDLFQNFLELIIVVYSQKVTDICELILHLFLINTVWFATLQIQSRKTRTYVMLSHGKITTDGFFQDFQFSSFFLSITQHISLLWWVWALPLKQWVVEAGEVTREWFVNQCKFYHSNEQYGLE